MTGDLPELHTAEHNKWDQGGYCNELVLDPEGFATDCGFQQPVKRHSPLRGQIMQYVDSLGDSYGEKDGRYDTMDADNAHVITSMVKSGGYRDDPPHKVVIDLDLPAQLIPSSTPDHYHLYIDHEIPWSKYLNLLKALEEAGLIQTGYLGASEARGFTAVRLPWIKKEQLA